MASSQRNPSSLEELDSLRLKNEAQLKATPGTDPLTDWTVFIKWVFSAYKDQAENIQKEKVYTTISNCCHALYEQNKSTKRYFDNDTFVKLWLKMAADSPDPLKTFEFMHKEQIGPKSVDLYVYWANSFLDRKNDAKEALRLLQLGVTACKENAAGLAKLQKLQADIAARPERKLSLEKVTKPATTVKKELKEEKVKEQIASSEKETPTAKKKEAKEVETFAKPSRVVPARIPAVEKPVPPPSNEVVSPASSTLSSTMSSTVSDQSSRSSVVPPPMTSRQFQTSRKPRDSLCIKRYDKLHVHPPVAPPPTVASKLIAMSTTTNQMEVAQKTAVVVEEIKATEQVNLIAEPKDELDSGPTSQGTKKRRSDDDSGLSSQNVHEASPGLSQKTQIMSNATCAVFLDTETKEPPSDANEEPRTLPQTQNRPPGLEAGQAFAFDHFASNDGCEMSFEERLALRYRCKQSHTIFAVLSGEVTIDETLSITQSVNISPVKSPTFSEEFLQIKDQNFQLNTELNNIKEEVVQLRQKLETSERARIIFEEEYRILKVDEAKFKTAIEKLDSAEDLHTKADSKLSISKEILHTLTSVLSAFSQDLGKDEMAVVDAVLRLARMLQERLKHPVGMGEGESDEHFNVLKTVTDHLVLVVERKRVRMNGKHRRSTGDFHLAKNSETTFGDDVSSVTRSGASTRSSILPCSQPDQTNPNIRAMWNSTINQTSRDSQPRSASSDASRHKPPTMFDETSRSLLAQPEPVTTSVPLPVRQSLAPRKSVKQPALQTSAVADPENVPMTVRKQVVPVPAFQIFEDQSSRQAENYLPEVKPKEMVREEEEKKDSDDDSENTPPIDSPQNKTAAASKSTSRKVTGVLNESLDIPAVPPDRLTAQDFIEVEASSSDSDYESEPISTKTASLLPPSDPPFTRLPTARPSMPQPRRSIALNAMAFDMNDEFNVTQEVIAYSRKSLGGATDQTLPFMSQVEFFQSIDPGKHMASTPVVLGLTEEGLSKEQMRMNRRPSYLPPTGVSKLLSPINEGSREKSTASCTSSSGVSTWTKSKSKKSLGTYSPLKENEEVSHTTNTNNVME